MREMGADVGSLGERDSWSGFGGGMEGGKGAEGGGETGHGSLFGRLVIWVVGIVEKGVCVFGFGEVDEVDEIGM